MIPHNQAVKSVLKYLKGTSEQGIMMNPYPKKDIEYYIDADFAGVWNQEEGKDSGSVLSRTGYIISYANCPIIWETRIQT